MTEKNRPNLKSLRVSIRAIMIDGTDVSKSFRLDDKENTIGKSIDFIKKFLGDTE